MDINININNNKSYIPFIGAQYTIFNNNNFLNYTNGIFDMSETSLEFSNSIINNI